MNLKQRLLTTAAAATLLGVVSAPAAQAAGLISTSSNLSFTQDTTFDFGFVLSQGQWRDFFGVFEVVNGQVNKSSFQSLIGEDLKAYDSAANDFNSTVGTSLSKGNAQFTFKAGKEYTLGLRINKTDTQPTSQDQYVFVNSAFNDTTQGYTNTTDGQVKINGGTSANPFAGLVTLAFEDHPVLWNGQKNWVDIDYNDFVVTAKATSVPEPATLAGLGLVAGALAVSRRRKASQSS
ncbi:MAG: PEP-CTERM sorting domain-containing protein [Phormidium sp.]